MFVYEKKLQYPVRISRPNPRLASVIISQYGGPDINRLQAKGLSPTWRPSYLSKDRKKGPAFTDPFS